MSFAEEFDVTRDPFEQLSVDGRDFYIPSAVARIEMPSQLVFLRDYVSKGIPVIISGGVSHWPAIEKWTPEYLRDKIGEQVPVTVDVTPNGRADDIDGEYFVEPEVRNMPFGEFMDQMELCKGLEPGEMPESVYYVQHQDDNFNKEFRFLYEDIETEISWAHDVFNNGPDVVNLWIGPDVAVTSMHRDSYENLYCVVKGEKHFTLLPPFDFHKLYEQDYQAGRYTYDTATNTWSISEEEGKVAWIPVDPNNPDTERFPRAAGLQPLHAVVRPGDIFYLPALWFHEVRQSAAEDMCTVAVNYWYDMSYDSRYVLDIFYRDAVMRRALAESGEGSVGGKGKSESEHTEGEDDGEEWEVHE